MSLVPMVVERSSNGDRAMDLFSRLMKDRIIMLNGVVDEHSANIIVGQMLYLESEDPDKEILFYINSGGGSVTAGMSVYDTMQFIKCDVRSIVTGQAASMASLLASAGTKGKRMMMRHSTHMIHQVLSQSQGQASDLEIHTNETLRWKKALNDCYVEHTGKDYETILKSTDRDNFMTASESVEFGLADEIIVTRE